MFSVLTGALADRFDPRRIIQIGMALFMLASVAWGILFWTGTLEMWHAVVILDPTWAGRRLLGTGGAAAGARYDIVGARELHSAVRLLATSRTLGLLLGPAVGGAAMILIGPAAAVLLNALIYLPLILWLWKAPYGPKFRAAVDAEGMDAKAGPRAAIRGFVDILDTIRAVAKNRTLITLTLLAGMGSLFVGQAYQAQMPEFATHLSGGADMIDTGIRYNILFAAAAGALTAGILLEARNLLAAESQVGVYPGGALVRRHRRFCGGR